MISGRRLARTIALAVIIGIGIFNLYQAVTNWTLSDAQAYWDAAWRLRQGQELYPPLASVEASEVYRYAPWFAWLAVPLTFVPAQVAGALWSAILLAGSAWALVPVIRLRAWVLVVFFAPILVGISAVGNVHPLLIASLAWGVERRSGPFWIAVAASLKVFPLLLALVYAGRRQWWRLGLTVGVAGLLSAPALLYDLSAYAVAPGQAAFLISVPIAYFAVVGLGVGATLALGPRWKWLAASTTVALSLPRFFVYDVTYLIVAVAGTNGKGGQLDGPS